MNARARVVFEVPGGGRVVAHPEEAKRTEDGTPFVWVRRHASGEITRAFAVGEMA